MTSAKRCALVTGAGRGLGLGVAQALAERGYKVIMAGRDMAKLDAAVKALVARRFEAIPHKLDMRNEEDVAALKAKIDSGLVIDILVNNAGVFLEKPGHGSMLQTSPTIAVTTMATNAIGPMRLIQAVLPSMTQRGWGRIVNVSSGMASLNDMGTGAIAYRMSKAALNVITRVTGLEVKDSGVLVNAVCPGWVRTDMGGPSATREIAEGVASILWAALLPDDGPTAGFFRDGQSISW
jgi:NAD(P)-dependent dehydrogenase (short-subunit alcohol dehydrogenase family)